jgi:uncharacterized RDD family membrane protein YckC
MENFTKASAGDRFIAALIDGIISAVPIYLFIPISFTLVVPGYALCIAYQLTKDALPFLNGQSIGKRVMKIKVVKQDTGEMITNDYGTAIIRQLSLLIPIFNIIDAAMVLGSEGLRFGDQWAKTRVVKA